VLSVSAPSYHSLSAATLGAITVGTLSNHALDTTTVSITILGYDFPLEAGASWESIPDKLAPEKLTLGTGSLLKLLTLSGNDKSTVSLEGMQDIEVPAMDSAEGHQTVLYVHWNNNRYVFNTREEVTDLDIMFRSLQ
jgi:hypothetical protein